jgi:gliding motility-associated-like protein
MSFTNNSTVTTGNIAQWNWNFNDNTTSTQMSPTHLFANPGTYNVTLNATSDNGCQSSVTNTVNVFPEPVPNFSASNVCIGNSMQFLNQTTINGGGNFYSTWEFGNGDTTNQTSPVYGYSTPGSYNVTLTVSSTNGCKAQVTLPVDVYRNPMARFAAPDACSDSPIHFNNYSSSQDGQITSNFWSFGDGSYSNDVNPVHMYPDSGTYRVELLAITNYGCMNSDQDSVSSFPNPEVNVAVSSACAGGSVSFTGNSNLQSGINYAWSLSNGTNSTAQSFNQMIYTPGDYQVTLTATTAEGCSGSTTNQFRVHPVPVALFDANEVCQDASTNFANTSIVSGGNINSMVWNFGDNQQTSQNNPSHTYNTWGVYNASLTITSDQGCNSTVMRQVKVHPKPNVTFNSGIAGCGPIDAFFSESSSIPEGTITNWLWNFSDGRVSNQRYTNMVFENSGTYDASLTVVSDFGCMNSYSQSNAVTVYPKPLADFTADPLITDMQMPLVNFTNQSQDYTSFQWIFGDGTFTTTEINPSHTFADTGTYTAKLITVNSQGCRDTIMKKIEVKLHSTLWIANCFTPNGDGNNDTFRPFHTNMEEVKVWIFDRWGKMLTFWNGLEGSWDGYYEGRKCQQDTYVYKIEGMGLDGKYSEWVGHVSIVY